MAAPATSALPPLLTVPEVAAALRVSRTTVERMAQRGDLNVVKLGRRDGATVRVRLDELERILATDKPSEGEPA